MEGYFEKKTGNKEGHGEFIDLFCGKKHVRSSAQTD
jgi:hypothetical protein